MKIEKILLDVGRGWGCSRGWFGGVRERESGDAKTCFSMDRASRVYYFKDMRQGGAAV